MLSIKALYLIFTFITIISACPSNTDIEGLNFPLIHEGFLQIYNSEVENKNIKSVAEYCQTEILPVLKDVNKKSFQYIIGNDGNFTDPRKIESRENLFLWFGLKICYNMNRLTLENIREAVKIDPINPIIKQVIMATENVVFIASFNGRLYAIKYDLYGRNVLAKENEIANKLYSIDNQFAKIFNTKKWTGANFISLYSQNKIFFNLIDKNAPKDVFVELCLNKYELSSKLLVMEFGGSTYSKYILESYNRNTQPPIDVRLKHYYKFSDILNVLNKENILYCDFKPENVVFDPKI